MTLTICTNALNLISAGQLGGAINRAIAFPPVCIERQYSIIQRALLQKPGDPVLACYVSVDPVSSFVNLEF